MEIIMHGYLIETTRHLWTVLPTRMMSAMTIQCLKRAAAFTDPLSPNP